ncbi:ABC transporter substrate-binding protein [Vibrio sp. PP-XX7]
MSKKDSSFQTSRRQFLLSSIGASVALGATKSFGLNYISPQQNEQETRTLDEIYQAAIQEGGKLIIYAGGDFDGQQDSVKNAFKARFPEIDITIVVDYSKYHDVRLDNQYETDTVVPDIMQLQLLQDFERWKYLDRLKCYKPLGFDNIHPSLRDSDGAWMAVSIVAFSFVVDNYALGNSAPVSAEALANGIWKGNIASSYPNDDDAVEFLYKLYTEAYGWDWLAAMAEQDIAFKRGSHTPGVAIQQQEKLIGIGTSSGGPIYNPDTNLRWVLPETDPFMAWGQRAAILKCAKNPEAAKLYMNWMVSEEFQSQRGWPIRTDLTPLGGLSPIWDYPNAHFDEFPQFMRNRQEVELWRQTFSLYFGEVQGAPSPGWLGLHPGA